MPVEKGWLFYSQPGHAVSDFENPVYSRIIMNAVQYLLKENQYRRTTKGVI
jgi:type 1 glutamine amidotransferase